MELPFQDLWLPAARARMVLFANHVLSGCAPAIDRLRAYPGKVLKIDVTGWPGVVPVPPPLVLRITPAGLLETLPPSEEAAAAVDLQVRLDASSPRRIVENAMSGAMPPLAVDGDAALAGDINWIAQNVRWDPAADAERFFGPLVAEGVQRAGAQLAQAAEIARDAMGQLIERMQQARPSAAPRKPK